MPEFLLRSASVSVIRIVSPGKMVGVEVRVAVAPKRTVSIRRRKRCRSLSIRQSPGILNDRIGWHRIIDKNLERDRIACARIDRPDIPTILPFGAGDDCQAPPPLALPVI